MSNPQTVKVSSTTGYKVAIIILAVIIIALIAFSSLGFAGGDRAKAEQNVKEIYKVITGSDPEIIKTSEQNGVYKITVRTRDVTGRVTVQDVFVTKDGLFFTDRLVDLEFQKSLLVNQSAFVQCLFDKQIRIIGLSTDTSTQAQLQALGSFAGRIYIDCGGQNLALCQQLNITQVPVVYNNGTLVQGPLNVQWFEQNVGCFTTKTGQNTTV